MYSTCISLEIFRHQDSPRSHGIFGAYTAACVSAGGKVKSQKTLICGANISSAGSCPSNIDIVMASLEVHVVSPLGFLLLSNFPQVLLWSYVLPEWL